MALDTRLIGQALGEGKPIDLASAVRPAAIRGERAFARTAAIKQQEEKELKAENQRRESLQARAISQLQDIDQTKVPAQIRDYITTKAFGLKQAALAVIQDKSIDPITAQLEIQKYMGEINNLSAKSNDFKEWQKLFIDTSKDDLSNLNTPEIISKVNDIQDGAMQLQENGMFKFKDGSEYSFDDMLKIRHVNKRSDSYVKALGAFEKLGLQSGLKGNSIEIFKTNADSEFKQLELTDADYASIAVDYLGMDANTNLGARIKADFESDGDFDDSDLKEEVYNFVKDNFIEAAETAYGTGKSEYDTKTAIKNAKEPNPSQIAGGQLAFDLILDPVSRLKEVTTADSRFDKETGIFSFDITEGTEAEPVTVTKEYNMATEADIIRLARDILNNEGETSANKTKIIGALKEFLTANQKVLNERKEFYEENTRVKKVKSVLDQLEGLQEDKYSQYRKE